MNFKFSKISREFHYKFCKVINSYFSRNSINWNCNLIIHAGRIIVRMSRVNVILSRCLKGCDKVGLILAYQHSNIRKQFLYNYDSNVWKTIWKYIVLQFLIYRIFERLVFGPLNLHRRIYTKAKFSLMPMLKVSLKYSANILLYSISS